MDAKEVLELLSAPTVTVLCAIVWYELRGMRRAMKDANERVQEILVKALTGELKSYADWKANKPESFV